MAKVKEVESPTNGGKYAIEITQPYRVEVTLNGTCALLFHRWNNEAVAEKAKAAKGSAAKKSDDVESYVYRNENNELCLPGLYLTASIAEAARFQQDPRSPRKSARDLFKAGVVPLTELASLGTEEWDYESKLRVVVQRSGITRTRPAMFKGWKATMQLMVTTPEYIEPDFLQHVINRAGVLCGLADFRPTYGRFAISKYEVLPTI